MNARKKAIATAIAVGLATTLVPAAIARAADDGPVQDLRREVSQLRTDVQALRLAVADMAEVDRQQAADLTRALNESAEPVDSSEPATARPAPPAPAAPAANSEGKSRKSSHQHRHRHSSRARARDR
jgi:hypothetical protein